MLVRDILSWWARPLFLRSWGTRSDTLFAGPWVGEFGWELMSWQGFVRLLARRYTRVIVSCRRHSQALYRDFAHAFEVHDIRGTAHCNRLTFVENPESLADIKKRVPAGADWLRPLGYQPLARQEFLRFGTPRPELRTDIVFHPRGRRFEAQRNYSSAAWNRLLHALAARGYRLTCIGLTEATVAIEGDFVDLRDCSLEDTMDCLASARLAIGPSSGPMHLASLCGTPHLVWADRGRYARGLRSRDKYEWAWNPLETKAIVYDSDGYAPDREAIVGRVDTFLQGTPSAAQRLWDGVGSRA